MPPPRSELAPALLVLERSLRLGSLVVFPLMVGALALLYRLDFHAYRSLTLEDSILENLTFVHFLLAAALAGILARRQTTPRALRLFYLGFMAFCVFCALEEISWGQRILGTESPEFFRAHNTQKETNLHNVFRKWTGVKTREIAAPVLLIYGALLPLARLGSGRRPPGRAGPERFRLPLPPAYLSVGFTLGAGIAWFDAPTGHEEEIGEYMLSLCLALFMLSEWLSAQRPAGDHAPSR